MTTSEDDPALEKLPGWPLPPPQEISGGEALRSRTYRVPTGPFEPARFEDPRERQ